MRLVQQVMLLGKTPSGFIKLSSDSAHKKFYVRISSLVHEDDDDLVFAFTRQI